MAREYKCNQCGETEEHNMMGKGHGRKSWTLCKSCHNSNTIARGRANRRLYIEYMGGKCVICGYNRCDDALEFHHPAEKDPNFRSIRYWGFEKAKKELDRCVLLCSNCHREVNYGELV